MDLRQLEEQGAFVPSAPIEKTVSWTRVPNGATEEKTDTFSVLVKKLSFGAIEQLLSPDNKQSERAKMSAFIAATIVLGDDGKQAFPFAKAFQLDPGFANVLMGAINEVNGTGQPAAKANGANGAAEVDDDAAKN
jgi:Phage tail assembly chaperone, TAC